MTANIGVIIGPMLGGLTSDPVAAYPGLFGGIKWLETYPYSPPNILSAMILAAASLSVWLGMDEVSFVFILAHGSQLTNVDTCQIQSSGGLRDYFQSQSYFYVEQAARKATK
jgi:hypothetical protein